MKILLIGPLPPPITGNSLANKIVVENLPKYYPNTFVDYINTSYPTFKEDIGKFSLKKVFTYAKQYKGMYKILKTDKVYMTTGQTFFGVLKYAPYIYFSKLLNKELIVHIHGDYLWQEYEKLNGIKKKIFKHLLSKFDKGIVLSKTLRRNLTPFLPNDKVFELPNFVEDYLFNIDIKKKLEKNFNELRIIHLSNLMKEKGILDFLQALIELKKEGIAFKAKIAGNIDDKLKDEIIKYLNELKDNTEYLGVISGQEKKDMLEWGNIFVFPTYYKIEGQPISVLEAMATGNIILTTNQGGISNIFKEKENGFYIRKKDYKDIFQKLKFISNNLDKLKNISKTNYTLVKKNYTVENFIKSLYGILEV